MPPSRGLRNNNPGNIRHGGSAWVGASVAQTDPDFLQFSSPGWGLRAIARTLLTYGRKRRAADGSPIDTLGEIITRWAPPGENDTAAYIADVAKRTGLDPDRVLNLQDQPTLRLLTDAIVHHENGGNPFSSNAIADAVQLAFIDAD